jgi:hypothetical protein
MDEEGNMGRSVQVKPANTPLQIYLRQLLDPTSPAHTRRASSTWEAPPVVERPLTSRPRHKTTGSNNAEKVLLLIVFGTLPLSSPCTFNRNDVDPSSRINAILTISSPL